MPQLATARAGKPKAYNFPGPVPKEALDWFKRKGLKVGFDYRDVWKEEHVTAFTIAKVMELDVLATVRGTLERAIEEGTTFQQFKKDITATMDSSGWSAYVPAEDKKKRNRRLRVIYDTNMRTARAAGQWQRIERTKRALPFLVYGLGPSLKHRPEHAAWNGLVLPVDDPFWDYGMPINAYGCKCHVRQAGRREAERLGISKTPPRDEVPWKNERTGKTEKIPRGIQPGFNYNAGKARTSGVEFALKSAAPPTASSPKQGLDPKDVVERVAKEERRVIKGMIRVLRDAKSKRKEAS